MVLDSHDDGLFLAVGHFVLCSMHSRRGHLGRTHYGEDMSYQSDHCRIHHVL